MNEHVTLMHPNARDSTARAISSGFPLDLLGQSAGRLRVLALLYAFVFFMAGILPALLIPGDRARFLGSFVQWGPGVIGIVVALIVALVIRSDRLPLSTVITSAWHSRSPVATPSPRPNLAIRWVSRCTPASWDSRGWPYGSCYSRSSCQPRRAGRCWPLWPRSARSP